VSGQGGAMKDLDALVEAAIPKVLCDGCAAGHERYYDEREDYMCHRTGTVIVESYGCEADKDTNGDDIERARVVLRSFAQAAREIGEREGLERAAGMVCSCCAMVAENADGIGNERRGALRGGQRFWCPPVYPSARRRALRALRRPQGNSPWQRYRAGSRRHPPRPSGFHDRQSRKAGAGV
jgi:hypothetical protein